MFQLLKPNLSSSIFIVTLTTPPPLEHAFLLTMISFKILAMDRIPPSLIAVHHDSLVRIEVNDLKFPMPRVSRDWHLGELVWSSSQTLCPWYSVVGMMYVKVLSISCTDTLAFRSVTSLECDISFSSRMLQLSFLHPAEFSRSYNCAAATCTSGLCHGRGQEDFARSQSPTTQDETDNLTRKGNPKPLRRGP